MRSEKYPIGKIWDADVPGRLPVEENMVRVSSPVYVKNISGVIATPTAIQGQARPNAITFDIFRPLGVDEITIEKYTARARITNEASRLYVEYMKVMHPKDSVDGAALKSV